jgi:hypothetical protein
VLNLKLSQLAYAMKYSLAISHVKMKLGSKLLKNNSAPLSGSDGMSGTALVFTTSLLLDRMLGLGSDYAH